MSVLIKGAKMPSTCRDCFVMCDNYDKETWRYARHKNCPLVEIPTPHGRLIDADDIKTITVACTERGCIKHIDAPIVIESEE